MCECKICKSQVSKEAEAHVNNELAKMMLDPSYKPETFKGKKQ